MEDQQATRLRALWKSGRDKFRSLYVVLAEVQKEVGHRQLSKWCAQNLGMGLPAIMALKS